MISMRREREPNTSLMSTARERIERNIEYHQQIAEHYKQIMEDGEENGEERSEAEQQAHDKAMEEAQTLAEMHGDAAKMLREAMGMDVEPAIVEEKANRQIIRRLN